MALIRLPLPCRAARAPRPSTLLLAGVLAFAGLGPAAAQSGPAAPLYASLGEKPGIRALMDDFVRRVVADPRIGAQFRDTKADHLASQLTDQVCQASGGPCRYEGPSMKEAHDNLEIRRGDFNALVEVLIDAMDAKGLPFARQRELLALLAPMHRDIVNTR